MPVRAILRNKICLLFALCWGATSPAVAQRLLQLASEDTAITVAAGESAPRLMRLATPGEAPWNNDVDESLPSEIAEDGVTKRLQWHLVPEAAAERPDRLRLLYESTAPHLRLIWEWRRRADHGPLEHRLLIENLSGHPLLLPWQPTFRFAWTVDASQPLERFWIEKGADAPSSEGIHRDAIMADEPWFGASSTYARPVAGQPREMIPYLLVDNAGGAGWYVGIEFSGRTRITLLRTGTALRGEAGLNPDPGPYRTRLSAGETYETPSIFLGAFRGGADGAGNGLRRWVRAVLNNPRTLSDPHFPLMVDNSWGSGTAVDENLARRMIVESQRLGLEMFHLDAGWFRGVGDWQPDPVKFPHGVAATADFAHRHQLKFGLWVDWTQAGVSTAPGARRVTDPETRDWLIADPPEHWRHQEEFKGITMDIGVPAAHAWALHELERLVSEYHLDMLEHDGYLVAQGSARSNHPAMPPEPGTLRVFEDSGYLWAEGSNATDVSDHATRAYYDIYARLRRRHPDLLLEVCNDGGRMVDFGSAAHGDYFSITDIYDPLSNRRAFFDASYVLPPAMLESYVEKWPAPTLDAFRYMLRSGMMGWFSLMLDTSQWNQAEHAAALAEFSLYKSRLRPLIRAADLYHVADRPDGVHWDGIEYFSAAAGRGVLFAFRGSIAGEGAHRYVLRGLDAGRSYRVVFHDRGESSARIVSGEVLMREGLEVQLASPLSSELVFLSVIG